MQQVKDLAFSLQQLRLLLCFGFDPWPGNFHMPRRVGGQKKKKKKVVFEKDVKMVLEADVNAVYFSSLFLKNIMFYKK